MKRNSTILLFFISLNVLAQFPSPTNFLYDLHYTVMRGCGNCCGMTGDQGSWCSSFSWNAPDTTLTISKLSYYNIYYFQIGTESAKVIATSKELSKSFYYGPTGTMWITAVYTNPNGESAPSNICSNYGLPIEVPIVKEADNVKIHFDVKSQMVHISSKISFARINFIDTNGKLIKTILHPTNKIDVNDLFSGCYVVELCTDNAVVYRQKLIK